MKLMTIKDSAGNVMYHEPYSDRVYQVSSGLGEAKSNGSSLLVTGITKIGEAVLPGLLKKLGGSTKEYKSAASSLANDLKLIQGDTRTLDSNISRLKSALNAELKATSDLKKYGNQLRTDITLASQGNLSEISKNRKMGYIISATGTVLFIASFFIPKHKKRIEKKSLT